MCDPGGLPTRAALTLERLGRGERREIRGSLRTPVREHGTADDRGRDPDEDQDGDQSDAGHRGHAVVMTMSPGHDELVSAAATERPCTWTAGRKSRMPPGAWTVAVTSTSTEPSPERIETSDPEGAT